MLFDLDFKFFPGNIKHISLLLAFFCSTCLLKNSIHFVWSVEKKQFLLYILLSYDNSTIGNAIFMRLHNRKEFFMKLDFIFSKNITIFSLQKVAKYETGFKELFAISIEYSVHSFNLDLPVQLYKQRILPYFCDFYQ